MEDKARFIAIHLPQFHPIPENDEWWGKGFTEWTNVTKAEPFFEGHYQPHLPSDLGFYDLRLEETRLEQEKLAKEYGISGFCYYHYWFNGKRLLHEPLKRKLANPKEDLPFMICWANENWTRVWDGGEKAILMGQNYSDEDHINHIRQLIPMFKDERYIKIDGKPVFSIYRTIHIKNLDHVIELWRNETKKEGFDLYVMRFESGGDIGEEFMTKQLDAAVEFQPHSALNHRSAAIAKINQEKKAKFKTLKQEISFTTIKNSINTRILKPIKKQFEKNEKVLEGQIIDYKELIDFDIQANFDRSYKFYPCVCPGFDNTSRRKTGNFLVLNHTSPDLFRYWIEKKIGNFKPYSKDENFFFINAWNEWAEGNHLEPDIKWGRKYLEVVKSFLKKEN